MKSSRNQELFDLFDAIICGDDPNIKQGKPAPDLFLAARARMGDPPLENCLVFEDAINGIEAALNAGMHVCIYIYYCLLRFIIESTYFASFLLLFYFILSYFIYFCFHIGCMGT